MSAEALDFGPVDASAVDASPEPLRVLVADDQKVVRDGLTGPTRCARRRPTDPTSS